MRRMTGDFPSESAREAATANRHFSALVRSPCQLPGPHSTSALQRSRPRFAITDAQRGAPPFSPPVAPRQPTSRQQTRRRTGPSARDRTAPTMAADPLPRTSLRCRRVEMLHARLTLISSPPHGSPVRHRGSVRLDSPWSVREVQQNGPEPWRVAQRSVARSVRQRAWGRTRNHDLEICPMQDLLSIYYTSKHRTTLFA